MTVPPVTTTADRLPHALDAPEVAERLAGRRLAVFLDYDGVLTPIVDRPQDAVMSDGMREVVQALAQRCSVCVVSGRDRAVVTELMGVDDLMVAGSHGFDIYEAAGGPMVHEAAAGLRGPDRRRSPTRLQRGEIEDRTGTVVEPKRGLGRPPRPAVADPTAHGSPRWWTRCSAEHPGEPQGDPREDGARDPAEDRLEQGEGRRPPDRRARPRRRGS